MLDFSYCNPTRLVFGRTAEAKIGGLVAAQTGVGGKVLVVYGGGSAKRSGLLGLVTASLTEAGLEVLRRAGCSPIPGSRSSRKPRKTSAAKRPPR